MQKLIRMLCACTGLQLLCDHHAVQSQRDRIDVLTNSGFNENLARLSLARTADMLEAHEFCKAQQGLSYWAKNLGVSSQIQPPMANATRDAAHTSRTTHASGECDATERGVDVRVTHASAERTAAEGAGQPVSTAAIRTALMGTVGWTTFHDQPLYCQLFKFFAFDLQFSLGQTSARSSKVGISVIFRWGRCDELSSLSVPLLLPSPMLFKSDGSLIRRETFLSPVVYDSLTELLKTSFITCCIRDDWFDSVYYCVEQLYFVAVLTSVPTKRNGCILGCRPVLIIYHPLNCPHLVCFECSVFSMGLGKIIHTLGLRPHQICHPTE